MDLPIQASDHEIVRHIQTLVYQNNLDNISRTKAYFEFFQKYPEIRWSFLAHMVSRNAGWNMCDLEGKWFPRVISQEKRKLLFKTYERANWLIFQDAYPQLLLYHYSTKKGSPMFQLLGFFHVSKFMEREWQHFWREKDLERLMISLIINEQNVIQNPVIQHPSYRKNVFRSWLFNFQDWLHYSCVLFPTITGELYGSSVNGFTSVDKRIDLGKRLSSILFDNKLFPSFYKFASKTAHTGSRFDYEQYLHPMLTETTPELRKVFPVINHHIHQYEDWSLKRKIKTKWLSQKIRHIHPTLLTDWFKNKQKKLHRGIFIKSFLTGRSK